MQRFRGYRLSAYIWPCRHSDILRIDVVCSRKREKLLLDPLLNSTYCCASWSHREQEQETYLEFHEGKETTTYGDEITMD